MSFLGNIAPPSESSDGKAYIPISPQGDSAEHPEPSAARAPSISANCQQQSGEAGEGGVASGINLTNAEFVAAIFRDVPEGASVAVCTKSGDPTAGGWTAQRAERVVEGLSKGNNNYVACSSIYSGADGSFKATKSQAAVCHYLLLDDLNQEALGKLSAIKLSWLTATSPNNYQGGIAFFKPLEDKDWAERILRAIIEKGLSDPGATSAATRWGRLPNGINGKAKYASEAGAPFECRLIEWNPDARYTPDQVVALLDLTLPPAGKPKALLKSRAVSHPDEVLTLKANENPVITALRQRDLYKKQIEQGKHEVTCPRVYEHTGAVDNGTVYFEPDESHALGGFRCQHSHGDTYRIRQVLQDLGVTEAAARHQTVVQVASGQFHQVVQAMEHVLATQGRYYASGGLIASVNVDPANGNPTIAPTSIHTVMRELSKLARWEQYDKRSGDVYVIDPPQKHVSNLFDAGTFDHLLPLLGVARQPYFRFEDGVLILEPGYDSISRRFGAFDPQQFKIPVPTRESAELAMAMIEDVLSEFHFVSPADKSAALAAIFTAVVRASIKYAPGFHVRAPVIGSGKSFLCESIGLFASAGGNAKVSYPVKSEEATKVILSLLLTGPAVIEFDDMDTDWIPHGVINRMFTADKITDRILGYSKTATVSTQCLFLGSGNNVGPTRDLMRRVLIINVDPRCATPATMKYKSDPVAKVRANRGAYVAAVLTVVAAWRAAGSPRTDIASIASYGGEWTEYCRRPLVWMGYPDPATSLIEQIQNDPDAEALGRLLKEWRKAFGSAPTTVRKAVAGAGMNEDLLDAMKEFPVNDRGDIDRNKLGWFLRRNANRIVGGLEFERTDADGRAAWRVVGKGATAAPASPALPVSPATPPASAKRFILETEDYVL